MTEEIRAIRRFFVDEAGDGTVFDSKGNVIVGTEGCSRYFLLGLLDVAEPERLTKEMEELRTGLLADPYFKCVPSMQVEERKTALAFHAKDDLPEVRREVFSLLRKHELRFYAVVRDKSTLAADIQKRNKAIPEYRYNPNHLYDNLVQRLFAGLLHKYDAYDIYFAKRGKSDRNSALREALNSAQRRVTDQIAMTEPPPFDVTVCPMTQQAELQAVDYFLWALQRLYERQENRYLELLWRGFRSVCYTDNRKKTKGGIYYTQARPLTRAALEEVPGI